MKTTKSKIIASVTALVLLFGVFFMVKAMEKNDKVENHSKSTAVPFYYTGPVTTNLTTMQDLNNWSTTQNSNHECGGEAKIPCSIPAESQSDLNSKLQACSTIDDVLDEAPARRQNK